MLSKRNVITNILPSTSATRGMENNRTIHSGITHAQIADVAGVAVHEEVQMAGGVQLHLLHPILSDHREGGTAREEGVRVHRFHTAVRPRYVGPAGNARMFHGQYSLRTNQSSIELSGYSAKRYYIMGLRKGVLSSIHGTNLSHADTSGIHTSVCRT